MSKIRTRFAPSPTGRMHVGNLRTALYEYLIARHEHGTFVLRIEDTDQERFVPEALDIIYNTMKLTGLQHDEGPDKDGGYGPYVQSERMKARIRTAVSALTSRVSARRRESIWNMPGNWWKKERLITASVRKSVWKS